MKRMVFLLLGAMMMFAIRSGAQSSIPTAGLQLWLRADAGVDTLNGTVGRWHDQSGNGNDAIQASPTRQPLLVAGALNGKPVLHFDGLNDKLGFTGTTHMTQFSLFLVINNHLGTSGNSGSVITFGANGDFNNQWFMGMQIPSGPDTIGMLGNNAWINAVARGLAAYDEWRNLSVVANQSIWTTALRSNGKNAQMFPGGSGPAFSVPLGDATGSGGGIGGADGVPYGTIQAKCDVAEVVVYNVALSDSARNIVESYLATKYGLPQSSIPTAGLQLWLKADAGVDTLNGTVGRWHDQSGNGNDAIQASASRQPVLVAGALNGKPAVRFDGVNDKLGFTGTTHMTQFSLFLIINDHQGPFGGDPVITFGANGDFGHQWFMLMRYPSTSDSIGLGTGVQNASIASSAGLAAYDQWRNLNIITTGSVFNTMLRRDGIAAHMSPVGSDQANSYPLGDVTGSGGGIGGADGVPAGTIVAKCDVAEILVYNVALSILARDSVERYLATRYGLPQPPPVTGISAHPNGNLPERYVLEQNYPNPFNPSTTIRYGLSQRTNVSLIVYNTLGQQVAVLQNGEQEAGSHEVHFDGSNLSSGVYFYRLHAGVFLEAKKFVLVR